MVVVGVSGVVTFRLLYDNTAPYAVEILQLGVVVVRLTLADAQRFARELAQAVGA